MATTPTHNWPTPDDDDPVADGAAAIRALGDAIDAEGFLTEAEGNGAYASSAQGALADSAVQPGDDADTLGSGSASDGQLATADGSGNVAWEDPPDSGAQTASGSYTGDGTTDRTIALSFDPVYVRCWIEGGDSLRESTLPTDTTTNAGFIAGAYDSYSSDKHPALTTGGFVVDDGDADKGLNKNGATVHYLAIG